MTPPRRWSSLSDPLRGAGYLIGLGVLIAAVAALMAGLLVWIMT
jgi:hypothetical protein